MARNYRGDVPIASAIEAFPMILVDAQQTSTAIPPCIHHKGISYMFVSHNDIYVLGLSKQNSNAISTLYFLQQIVSTLNQYFKRLTEETIRDNFVIIYELLDEMMDFGHPQISDYKVLQEYITQDSHPLAEASSVVTSAVSWRPEGIYYKKNELFLDVVESIDFLLGADGKVIRNEVLGKIQVNAYLSGMPQLKLGLNDIDKKLIEEEKNSHPDGEANNNPLAMKFTEEALAAAQKKQKRKTGSKQVHLKDIRFHQCVELEQFENDRAITFIPPDGKFELLSYRASDISTRPLFDINATIDLKGRSRVVINVTAKSQFRKRLTATHVEIAIPVPRDADSPRFKTSAGTVIYAPEMNAVVWKLKDFPGGQEYKMKAQVQLSSVASGGYDEGEDDVVTSGATTADSGTAFRTATINRIKNQPINVKFEIPYHAMSGLQVRYLKVEEPRLQYQALPWVRYLTKSGEEFSMRMPPNNVF